jgi:NAD(P)-dependent dehydrogenase (short-subunit alcohol dehydrogenase family)
MGSIKKAFDLTGKNALVTGGSRGLGLQIAEALGEQGARVVISSRKAPDLEKAQAHLAGLGIKAEWIAADNSRDEDVKRLSHEAIKKLGRVDILVNNAGATWGSPTEDHPIEAWVARRAVDVGRSALGGGPRHRSCGPSARFRRSE